MLINQLAQTHLFFFKQALHTLRGCESESQLILSDNVMLVTRASSLDEEKPDGGKPRVGRQFWWYPRCLHLVSTRYLWPFLFFVLHAAIIRSNGF